MNSKDLQERIEASARGVMRRSALIADVDLPACLASAILPIVDEEVRKAKAEAWDEGYMEATSGDGDPLANPYRYETGGIDEHR